MAQVVERSPSSRRKWYAAIRWLIRACDGTDALRKLVPVTRRAQPRTVTVPDASLERVLAASEPRLRFALLMARNCGLRLTTILNVAPCNVGDGRINIKSKGGTWTQVAVTKSIGGILQGVIPLCARHDKPILRQLGFEHAYQLSRRLFQVLDQLGMRKAWTFHDLRRTFAHSLYEQSHDLRVVQKQMGHTSPVHTLHYLVVERSAITQEQMEQASYQPARKVN